MNRLAPIFAYRYNAREEISRMNHQEVLNQPVEEAEPSSASSQHSVTMENSPEETIRRMRSLPERAARFKELLNAFREANSR